MTYQDACGRVAGWPRDDVREVELALLEAADAIQARVAELEATITKREIDEMHNSLVRHGLTPKESG